MAKKDAYDEMGPKAAKADKAMDKRLGIKIGSKEDERIDRQVAKAVKSKGPEKPVRRSFK